MKRLFSTRGLALRALDCIRKLVAKLGLSPTTTLFLFGFQTFTTAHPARVPSKTVQELALSPVEVTDYCQIGERVVQWFDTLPTGRRDFTLDLLCLSTGIQRSTMLDYLHFLRKDFRTWKVEFKVQRVMEMLIEDDMAGISETAREMGFNDMSNFHRQFKKLMGCSPREWRNNVMENKKPD